MFECIRTILSWRLRPEELLTQLIPQEYGTRMDEVAVVLGQYFRTYHTQHADWWGRILADRDVREAPPTRRLLAALAVAPSADRIESFRTTVSSTLNAHYEYGDGIRLAFEHFHESFSNFGIEIHDFTPEEAVRITAQIEEAMAIIKHVNPATHAFIKSYISLIYVKRSSMNRSFTRGDEIGSLFFVLQSAHADNIPDLVEGLIHESIHDHLHRLERRESFFTTIDLNQVTVASPWSGVTIDTASLLHAYFVWYGLWNFYIQCQEKGLRRFDAEALERLCAKGFLATEPAAILGDSAAHIHTGLLASLNEMMRDVRSHYETQAKLKKPQLFLAFGPKDDPESQNISEEVDFFFAWEDYGKTWSLFMQDGELSVTRGDFHPPLPLQANCRIYHRYPIESKVECDPVMEASLLIMTMKEELVVGAVGLSMSDNNDKLFQLSRFGRLSPHTKVVNRWPRLENPEAWITKGLSGTKTRAEKYMAHVEGGARIDLPVMLQKEIRGKEFKLHFFLEGGKPAIISHEVIRSGKEIDIRFCLMREKYRRAEVIPEEIRETALAIHRACGKSYFDMDYIVGGQQEPAVHVLEWNDSPGLTLDNMDPDGSVIKRILKG